jgi:acyl carrier protein
VQEAAAAAAQQPAAPPAPQPANITRLLLSLVSEKTGYPEEMLDMNANMEADLGIDSIKRVEILGALTRQMGLTDDVRTEKLTGLHTLGEIISFLEGQQNSAGEAAVTKKKPVTGR